MTTEDFSVIHSPDDVPAWPAGDATVRSIVVGKPPIQGESPSPAGPVPPSVVELPADFATRFPALTALHLWQIPGLEKLPELPGGLLVLDLRGCSGLMELPALPSTLETLDIGGCSGLERLQSQPPGALQRVYFNDCPSLNSLDLNVFLRALQNARVVEIDGSGSPAVTSLEWFPAGSLKKLVLEGCTNLTDISQLPSFSSLEHLNLSGCTALEELPLLPSHIRYLVLHGAGKLKLFLGQDIGPYDRGDENQNVANTFHSRAKFGHELAIMAHAKVLLLGDGRVGKTTLAKRLQWETLKPNERVLSASRELEPKREEPFTHKVHFWPWKVGLSLSNGEKQALKNRAGVAKLGLPLTPDRLLEGSVRIWDFGGQEIYHSTHRIFAGEGSIFLLVWREQEPDPGTPPGYVTVEEWKEWNRARPLDYWLDYVYSMRPNARVALVCTNCPDPDRMTRKPDWRLRAPRHGHRDLSTFFVDSLDPSCGKHQEFRRLAGWISGACAQEALRIGILQPRFYREVSDLVAGWLRENSRARQEGLTARHLLCPSDKWHNEVRAAHSSRPDRGAELDDRDIATITDYLHNAGQVFRIRQGNQRSILVDQEWASGLIYKILHCGGDLWTTVRENGGWFYKSHLDADSSWKAVESALERQQLLAYMEECRIITRIGSSLAGQNIYLALDKGLLPEYGGAVERKVEEQMARVLSRPGIVKCEAFEFGERCVRSCRASSPRFACRRKRNGNTPAGQERRQNITPATAKRRSRRRVGTGKTRERRRNPSGARWLTRSGCEICTEMSGSGVMTCGRKRPTFDAGTVSMTRGSWNATRNGNGVWRPCDGPSAGFFGAAPGSTGRTLAARLAACGSGRRWIGFGTAVSVSVWPVWRAVRRLGAE